MAQSKQRKPLRLRHYDYSNEGMYYVTVCVKDRKCLFGNMMGGEMKLNELGQMVLDTWNELPKRFSGIQLDEFVIMPNHIHGIIHIVGAQFIAPNQQSTTKGAINRTKSGAINGAPTLGDIIRAFKAVTTRKIHQSGRPEYSWQRLPAGRQAIIMNT